MSYSNKPVAWMWEQEINGLATETVFFTEKPFNNKAIPLYTHPVELTDELLMELYEVADYSPESYLELAKTILRKAQEK